MIEKKSLLEDPIFQNLVAAIATIVARLANLRSLGAYQEANAEIDSRLDELIGLKYDQIRYLDDKFILDLLTVNDILDVQRLWYLVILINARGEIQNSLGNGHEGLANRLRALPLLVEVAFSTSEAIDEVNAQIDLIANDLWEHLSEETLFSLFDLWEKRGTYAKALSALDQLVKISGENQDLILEREGFIRRLMVKTEEELWKGNLTPEHVQEVLNPKKER